MTEARLGSGDAVELLSAWGVVPREISPVRVAYRVGLADGRRVALKPAEESPGRLLVIEEMSRYLAARGFWLTAPPVPTLTGELFAWWGGRRWILSPWIDGREADYEAEGEMARCAGTLAAFHQAGLGFRARQGRLRSVIGKWPAKLRNRTTEMGAYLERARGAARPSEFERVMIDLGERFLASAARSSGALSRTEYEARCAWAAEASPLCHGDPSDRNFLFGEDGLVYVIDLVAAKHDLPELDLCRLLRRTMRRVDWEFEAAREMLAGYHQIRPLGRSALSIILAVLQFPDKAWRLLKQYYRVDGVEVEEKSRRLTRKLRKVAREMPLKARCLEQLQRL